MQKLVLALATTLLATLPPAEAQVHAHLHHHALVPITRSMGPPQEKLVQVSKIDAQVAIAGQIATTTLDIHLHNPHSRQLESELVLPVPDGSVLRGFGFLGPSQEATAKILPRAEARRVYDQIVARAKDPALLEFVGTGLLQSSVFPVPAGGRQQIRLTWEQILPQDGSRTDYFLPRSEGLDYRVPWTFAVEVRSTTSRIASIFSPTHELETTRRKARSVSAKAASSSDPGPFQLSILRQSEEGNDPTASLIAYPDPAMGGGYFLLLAAPPTPADEGEADPIRREVTVVIDRSGSMAGEKLDQVKAAALQVLEGLEDGESFNIITYNESVELFAEKPVPVRKNTLRKARQFLDDLRVSGGTNIHDALVEALRQKPTGEGSLPLVLFLTDGLPTIGQTSEKAIREAAEKGNPHKRRVFTLGVGVDVNTPLLNRLARDSRATSTYILPEEDVELKVASLFRRLSGPVLASPSLAVGGKEGSARVTELLPAELPDVFAGEQLVLLGQYRGKEGLPLKLSGRTREGVDSWTFDFDLSKATTRNAYVSRLWASNKIGVLSEAIRDLGADQGILTAGGQNPLANDPRVKELIDEIVRLSKEFGILTEYTAFFANEGTNLTTSNGAAIRAACLNNYLSRAVQTRSGIASVNQDANTKLQIESKKLNYHNRYWGQKMEAVQIGNGAVQQANDKAYFQRGGVWVDSDVLNSAKSASSPDRVVEVGTPAFTKLVDQLAAANRQGCFALRGQILVEVEGQSVLIR